MKHYENIKEHGDYITYNANIRPIINDNNWNNATYYLYKYIIDNIPFLLQLYRIRLWKIL